MKFSTTDVIELPTTPINSALRADAICCPDVLEGIISGHTSSSVPQDLSNFARHLSGKARNFLTKMGLRKITASLFVSSASNEYWGFNNSGNLCRLVDDGQDGAFADGSIDGYDLEKYADLDGVWSQGRLEASLL